MAGETHILVSSRHGEAGTYALAGSRVDSHVSILSLQSISQPVFLCKDVPDTNILIGIMFIKLIIL